MLVFVPSLVVHGPAHVLLVNFVYCLCKVLRELVNELINKEINYFMPLNTHHAFTWYRYFSSVHA